MHVEVDRALCEGHARCFAIATDAFRLDDEDRAVPTNDGRVSEFIEDPVRRAAAACPTGAITVHED